MDIVVFIDRIEQREREEQEARNKTTEIQNNDQDEEEDDEVGGEGDIREGGAIIACKARVKRTADNNPSIDMLKKDYPLKMRWTGSLKKELKGMVDKMALSRIAREEAMEIGITGHVTSLTMKRPGEGQEKARITINGAQEIRKGIFPDRKALYAPAIGEEGLLMFFAMAAFYDMTLSKSDVSQAFLYNDMDDAVVKRDIVIHLDEVECGHKGGAYYKYNRLGYGAPDASAAWAGQMARFLRKEGQLIPSQQLTCIWFRLVGKRGLIIAGIATDDVLQAGTRDSETQQELKKLREAMDKQWKMTHSPLDTALGVKVQRNSDRSITLTQPNQIDKIQKRFFPDGIVPEMYAPRRKGQDDDEEYETKVDNTEYRQLLGLMSHLRYTRHDAKASLAIGAESSTDPRVVDKKNLYDLAAYIITTREVGLTFHAGPEDANPREALTGWGASDASWSTTNEARTRIAFFLKMVSKYFKKQGVKTGAIVAKSMRETSISRSAAGGELMAEIEFVDANQIFLAFLDEITGFTASNTTISNSNKGRMERHEQMATVLKHGITDEKIQALLPGGVPTEILVDNRSLFDTTSYSMSKPLKKLKTLVRFVNIIINNIKWT